MAWKRSSVRSRSGPPNISTKIRRLYQSRRSRPGTIWCQFCVFSARSHSGFHAQLQCGRALIYLYRKGLDPVSRAVIETQKLPRATLYADSPTSVVCSTRNTLRHFCPSVCYTWTKWKDGSARSASGWPGLGQVTPEYPRVLTASVFPFMINPSPQKKEKCANERFVTSGLHCFEPPRNLTAQDVCVPATTSNRCHTRVGARTCLPVSRSACGRTQSLKYGKD